MNSKVLWTEGLFLQPHHFQQHDRYLERLVDKQALELEFLKGAQRLGPRPRSAPMSVIAGPAASPSRKDAD